MRSLLITASRSRLVWGNTVGLGKSQIKFFSTKYYTKSHEYIEVNGDVGTVGITNHAAELLGDVVFVELPKVGTKFEAGEVFGSVESVKAASSVYSPVSGEVVETNSKLESDPAIVNLSPFQDGWFIKIKLSAAGKAETSKLMDEAAYNKAVSEEEH